MQDSKLDVYSLESYEINKNTCAVINLADDVTKIVEKENEYLLPKQSFEVMEDSCAYYGSSYEGRLKGTKMILGSNYKLPVIIEEKNDIIFFPTTGLSNEKCSWISLNNIRSYERAEGYTKVNFVKGKSIIVKMSFCSFEMQLLRATRFQNLLRQRLGEK